MKDLIVVALGGNAIKKRSQKGTFKQIEKNIERAVENLLPFIKKNPLLVTHGNGPQVGILLVLQEMAKGTIPEMPIPVLTAQTDGWIGYLIQQKIVNLLKREHFHRPTGTVLTQVLVDKGDPAFKNPTKPVGKVYKEEEAKDLVEVEGWQMREEAQGGWRRVVASPRPIKIIEEEVPAILLKAHAIVVAVGGGGMPVTLTKEGFKGVEGVIDKDLTTALLASSLKAKKLFILTDIEKVFLNFGKKNAKPLNFLTQSLAEKYLAEGHFGEGSMKPKIEAAIAFLKGSGEEVLITDIFKLKKALAGKTGTWIIK